jgi:DNA-binding response OmpR family regulator/chromosome segregation ATPase
MKTRILVIDADQAPIEGLRDVLGDNFELVTSDNGAQGENLAREEPPAAVILSADVPNGFAHCRRFKKDSALARIPLILTSGELEQETLDKHSRLPTRADAYLKKPFNGETLLALIAELLAKPAKPTVEAEESDELSPNDQENRELQDAMRRLEYDQAEQTDRLDDAISALRSSETRVDELRNRLINESEGRESAETIASQYLDVLQTQGDALEKAESREANATSLLEKERTSSQKLIEEISRRETTAADRLQEMRSRIGHLETSIDQESTERQAHAEELATLTTERGRQESELRTLQETLQQAEKKEKGLAKRREELEGLLHNHESLLAEREQLRNSYAELKADLQDTQSTLSLREKRIAEVQAELGGANELAVELDTALVAERQKNTEVSVHLAQLKDEKASIQSAMDTGDARHEEHIRIQREEHGAEQQRARDEFEATLRKSNEEHGSQTQELKAHVAEELAEMEAKSTRQAETSAATQATLERAVAEAHESRGRLQAEMQAAHETATGMEAQLKQSRESAERHQTQFKAIEEELERTRDAGEVLLQDLANAQARQATHDSQLAEAREKASHFEATADQSTRQLERKDMELRSLEQKFEILGMRFAQAEEIQHLQNNRIQQVAGMLQNAATALAGDPDNTPSGLSKDLSEGMPEEAGPEE